MVRFLRRQQARQASKVIAAQLVQATYRHWKRKSAGSRDKLYRCLRAWRIAKKSHHPDYLPHYSLGPIVQDMLVAVHALERKIFDTSMTESNAPFSQYAEEDAEIHPSRWKDSAGNEASKNTPNSAASKRMAPLLKKRGQRGSIVSTAPLLPQLGPTPEDSRQMSEDIKVMREQMQLLTLTVGKLAAKI
jgi:hypothetical protein